MWTGQDYGHHLPSEVFRDQVLLCFINDRTGIEALDRLNGDNIMWECDYPHSDAHWPDAPEALYGEIQSLSDEQVSKITHLNAMRHFQYDPFEHISLTEATVAARRAHAAGWDVSVKSMARGLSSNRGVESFKAREMHRLPIAKV
jgi:hypothetical protein